MQTSPHRTDPESAASPGTAKPAGFTLVEVLVALVILALISTVIGRLLQGSLKAKQLQRNQIDFNNLRSDSLARQFSGELDDPIVTLERIEEDE